MSRNSDIAWLAGLFEGEGSIFERPKKEDRRSSWCISLEMTDKDVVEKAATIWGYGSVRRIPGKQRIHSLGSKDLYVWRFESRTQVYAFLAAIYPWLGNRRGLKAKKALRSITPVIPFKRGPKVLMSKEHLKQAKDLQKLGHSYRNIAGILGCSFSTVQRRLSTRSLAKR